MATWVYKNGEGSLIGANDVANHLKAGFTLDKNPAPKKAVKAKPSATTGSFSKKG
jgi:hypothetical protein